jgi:elongation factor G
MKVEVVAPVEFQSMFLSLTGRLVTNRSFTGAVIGSVNKRRGLIIDNEVREDEFTATAEVALNDMFGYSSALRGVTQGKGPSVHLLDIPVVVLINLTGEFSMEYKV